MPKKAAVARGGRAPVDPWVQLRRALLVLAVPIVVGTIGHRLFGHGFVDSAYQTFSTIATVGFGEIDGPYSQGERIFSIVLLAGGLLAAAYAFGLLLDLIVENHIGHHLTERRMNKGIDAMQGHLVVCGLGRVGRNVAEQVSASGRPTVVIDRDPERVERCELPSVLGDATDDAVLRRAGLERAGTLVVALDTDEACVFVTLSARSINRELFIVARAHAETATQKLLMAGADRVVNPQVIGGDRMAALALRPNVAEFLDVVMQADDLQFRLEEVVVEAGSRLPGCSLRDAHLRDTTGALVLALRHGDGSLTSNPPPETVFAAGDIVIAIGTQDQLERLGAACASAPAHPGR